MSIIYQNILTNIGGQQVLKNPDIPDLHLMVGTAECLSAQPVLVYENYMKSIPKPLQPYVTNENVNGTVNPNEFLGNTFYMGESISYF